MTTAIEQMIGRELDREQRVGVPHFKPGQHEARLTSPQEPDVAELSFVDAMGHAWFVLCTKDGEAWDPVTAFRGGQLTVSERPAPALSERMLEALEKAQ